MHLLLKGDINKTKKH